jgi:hypothetical protein
MNKISKALGAAAGGGLAGGAVSALPILPEGTPWYGYLMLYALTTLVPAVLTYLAPANKA